jgi:hypothetical protein
VILHTFGEDHPSIDLGGPAGGDGGFGGIVALHHISYGTGRVKRRMGFNVGMAPKPLSTLRERDRVGPHAAYVRQRGSAQADSGLVDRLRWRSCGPSMMSISGS